MRTIAIHNLKGGVGKTVTAISLSRILTAEYGKRVMLVDCDGQCNLTRFFIPREEDVPGVYEVLTGAHEPLWSDNVDRIDDRLCILAASSALYELDVAAITRGNANLDALRGFISAAEDDGEIDVVLFDCPPGFSAASCAALTAAREVLIPVLMDGFSLEGMADMTHQLRSLRSVNPGLKLAGVLINQWHRSPAVEKGEELLRSMPLPVCRTVIRRTDKVPESTFTKQPLVDYSRGSSAAHDYRALARELFGEVR